MIDQPLAISLRPHSFDDMIGAEKIVTRIRARVASHRMPKAWLLSGGTGTGKTTLGRILANALQCHHQTLFGNPCRKCIKNRRYFDITEIPPDNYSADSFRDILSAVPLSPRPGSHKRIYILDEFHRASKAAMGLLLKPFEDCPKTTVFIICTTEPDEILRTVRRRCARYVLPSLDLDDVRKLVTRGLKKIGSELNIGDLSEALLEKGVTSPGLVLLAVEKYAEGCTAEEAAEVELDSEVDIIALCSAIRKGDWANSTQILANLKPEDVRAIQGRVCRYMQAILLGETDFTSRTAIVAKSILKLSELQGSDNVKMAALTAVLWNLCRYFKEYRR